MDRSASPLKRARLCGDVCAPDQLTAAKMLWEEAFVVYSSITVVALPKLHSE